MGAEGERRQRGERRRLEGREGRGGGWREGGWRGKGGWGERGREDKRHSTIESNSKFKFTLFQPSIIS